MFIKGNTLPRYTCKEGTVGHSLQQTIRPDCSVLSLSKENMVQRRLTNQLMKSMVDTRIDTAASARESARLRSLQGRGVGAWLQAIPISNKFALRSQEYK